MTEESETLNLHIPPHSKVYIWQYQMGFGQEKNLFSPDLEITEDTDPPDEPAMYSRHEKKPNQLTPISLAKEKPIPRGPRAPRGRVWKE